MVHSAAVLLLLLLLLLLFLLLLPPLLLLLLLLLLIIRFLPLLLRLLLLLTLLLFINTNTTTIYSRCARARGVTSSASRILALMATGPYRILLRLRVVLWEQCSIQTSHRQRMIDRLPFFETLLQV